MAGNIPKEIWVEIWSLVDFRTLQKSCTLVCKDWFGGIRGSTSLSSQMVLKNWQKSIEDINLVLAHWEKLRIVRMSSGISNDELLQLDTHPSLEKIIFPKKFELGIWGEVTKVCFDLKTKSPATRVENIVELHLVDFFEKVHWRDYRDQVHQPFLKRFKTEDISMEAIARMMINLETLQIFDDGQVSDLPEKMKYFEPFFHGLQYSQSLLELIMHTDFAGYEKFTPNIKKLTICGHFELNLEDLEGIENFEKLEILKLEMLRFEDKEIDIKDCIKECV